MTRRNMKQKGKARADRVLTEERVPYLTDWEREGLARFLERLEAECGDRVQRVVLFGSRARGDHLVANAERFVARMEAFLREQGLKRQEVKHGL